MALITRYTVRIRTADRGPGDLPGFLDMLRYDNPRVEGWEQTEDGLRITLLFLDRPPTIERWQSFGLYPQEVSR